MIIDYSQSLCLNPRPLLERVRALAPAGAPSQGCPGSFPYLHLIYCIIYIYIYTYNFSLSLYIISLSLYTYIYIYIYIYTHFACFCTSLHLARSTRRHGRSPRPPRPRPAGFAGRRREPSADPKSAGPPLRPSAGDARSEEEKRSKEF